MKIKKLWDTINGNPIAVSANDTTLRGVAGFIAGTVATYFALKSGGLSAAVYILLGAFIYISIICLFFFGMKMFKNPKK